ncbi:hypothetical protein DV738_g1746, partial [Chaetothyriales sp. CBS 135597]
MAAQILPNFQPYFTSQHSSLNTSVPFATYIGANDESFSFFQPELQEQRTSMTSPYRSTSRKLKRPSPIPSSNAHARISPRRDRTPIRRNTPTAPKLHSQTRAEVMMPYTPDGGQMQSMQLSQTPLMVLPSESVPTMPHIMGAHSPYPEGESYGTYVPSGNFVMSAGSPALSSVDFNFQSEQANQDYYQMNLAVSQAPLTTANLEVQQSIYGSFGQQSQAPLTPAVPVAPSFPPITMPLESNRGDLEISSSRPKPQCWDHGCNGRQFSTFSNLLRHQREKNGHAIKAVCPDCGMLFTRTTARNGHMNGGKCKGRADSQTKATLITE